MIQVLQRAAAVLRALEDRPEGRTLAELAGDVGLPRSTVHRLVQTMQGDHLVAAVSDSGGFRLGPGVMRLAASSNRWLAAQLHEHLRALSREVGETVDLSVRSGSVVLFIDQITVAHRLQAVSAIGRSFPLHCSAPGKALLAELPADEVDELVGPNPERLTEHTIVSLDALHRDLADVRRTSVAIDDEEHHAGICAVGTRLDNLFGLPSALSIPVPVSRFAGRQDELAQLLLSARAAIEATLAT